MSIRRVYVAGPVFGNVREALLAGASLMAAGYEPFVPHAMFSLHMLSPQDYERWMQYSFAWLDASDALLRLPGESRGADREVERALERGIPVFRSMIELNARCVAEDRWPEFFRQSRPWTETP